jgi:hypothetical protein
MLPNVLQVISRAIRERRCLAIHYDGQRQVRVVEPHAVYADEHDALVLDAYQIRGYSEAARPTPSGGRCRCAASARFRYSRNASRRACPRVSVRTAPSTAAAWWSWWTAVTPNSCRRRKHAGQETACAAAGKRLLADSL